jgi:hypothetical protein
MSDRVQLYFCVFDLMWTVEVLVTGRKMRAEKERDREREDYLPLWFPDHRSGLLFVHCCTKLQGETLPS